MSTLRTRDPAGSRKRGRSRTRALYELGGRRNYERASRLFVDSIRLAPDRPEARTALGLLKYEAYGEAAGFPSGEKDLKKVYNRARQEGSTKELLDIVGGASAV